MSVTAMGGAVLSSNTVDAASGGVVGAVVSLVLIMGLVVWMLYLHTKPDL